MATTSNTFEEVLRLVIEAGGNDDVQLLLKQLDQLQAVSAGGSKAAIDLAEKLKNLATTAAQIQSYTKLKGEIAETATAIARESEKLVALKKDIDEAEKPSATLTRAYEKSQKALDALILAQNRQSVELQKTAGALTKAGVDTTHLAQASAKLQGEIGGVNKQLETATAATAKSSAGMTKLEGATTRAGEGLKNLALKFGAVAIAAEAAHKTLDFGEDFISEAVHHAEDLEQAIASAGAVTGATAEQMRHLKDAAEEASRKTKFNAQEAAQGLVELGRAGLSATDSIKALPAALNLAQAAGTDVATAAQLVVQSLAEFHLRADQAAHVTDLLAKGAKSGGLGLQGLSEELAKTAPLAHQLGLDADQTVAVLAALAKEGLRGRIAAGGLRDAFTELADPTSKFSSALLTLGIHTRDFNQVIVELGKRGHEGQRAIEALSANARVAITALVADGGAKIRELQGDLHNVAGSAAETAKAMDDTLGGAFNALGKSYEQLQEQLFEPILAPLKNDIRELAEALHKFASSPDFAEIRDAIKEMFTEGEKAARELIHNIDFHKLAENIKSFVGDAKGYITDFRENLSGIITAVRAVYEAFRFAFHAIEGALAGIATAVAAVVSAVAKVSEKVYELQSIGSLGLADKLGLGGKQAADQMRDLSGAAEELAKTLGTKTVDAVDAADTDFTNLTNTVSGAADATTQATTQTAKATGELGDSFEAITGKSSEAAQGLDNVATAADKAAASQDKAARASKEVEADLAKLGITTETSQKALEANAAATEAAFHTVVEQFRAGRLAIEDVRRAYAAYAQAQRESVAQSDHWKQVQVEAQLAVQAQTAGVTESLHRMGDVGEEAGHRVARGAAEAAASFERTSAAAHDAAKAGEDLSVSMKESSYALGNVSQAAADAYRSANKYVEFQDVWREQINRTTQEWRRQKKALDDVSDALDRQLQKSDPLAEKIKALRAQYGYVPDAQLRAVAEKQQRVEDEAKRAAEERARAQREALARVNAQTVAPSAPSAAAGDGSHPLVNPNLGNASGSGAENVHVFRFELPQVGTLSQEQKHRLFEEMLTELKRELERMLRR